jgi:hypothetical protein
MIYLRKKREGFRNIERKSSPSFNGKELNKGSALSFTCHTIHKLILT